MKYFGMTTLVLVLILGAGAPATQARSNSEGYPHGRKLLCGGYLCDAASSVNSAVGSAVRIDHGDKLPTAPAVVSKPAVATSSEAAPKGVAVSSSNSAGWTGKDKGDMQSFEPNKKALYNSGGCVACADVVISADKNHNGNVNCPGGNESQCRVAGSNTGKNYNNGANSAAGNNGNGGYDVVNKNDCNPSTHYACCLYKGKYNTDEYCKGSAECCSKH